MLPLSTIALWGFIDKKGQMVVQPQYTWITDFSEGLAAVNSGDFLNPRYGYIDQQGQAVIPMQYKSAKRFSEGLAPVTGGYIDKTGRMVIRLQTADVTADEFSEGLAAVMINSKRGYIDKSGNFVIQPKYFSTNPFKNGLARVWENGNKYIDKSGRVVWAENK